MYHFNEVNPDFFNKLKEACSDLTENNLRMCAYFKMGMTAKQVASILNISVETVKNGRYRLKKKLGLTEQDNLDDFIRNI
ncbi:Bacterial regulatory protein, luxR family [compost metagenome]